MAYSATLANLLGRLSDADHRRILTLFSRAGLSMDHPQFDEALLDKATAAILKTRDGKLRAAVPSPLGKCVFLNDIDDATMCAALRRHKELMAEYPRCGAGVEAYVDASDTGYTVNATPVEEATGLCTSSSGGSSPSDDTETGTSSGLTDTSSEGNSEDMAAVDAIAEKGSVSLDPVSGFGTAALMSRGTGLLQKTEDVPA